MEPHAFPEKVTPFLRAKLTELKSKYGEDSRAYLGLALQYLHNKKEELQADEKNAKHYEAGVKVAATEELPPGLERLYAKSLVIEPTLVCLSHCRYCLRSNYDKHTLTENQLIAIARYCGNSSNRDLLEEVLITGGDPLIFTRRMEVLLNALIEHAPNIKIARIATRLTGQDPERIDDNVINLFKNKPTLRFELATQINHPVEFFPEVALAFKKISDLGVKIYSQNIILKGVNDDIDTLVELYNLMRINNIEAHYLFHCVPIRGSHHLRTGVMRSLDIVKNLVSSGKISGRAKPMFAAMTDIGKITFYEGVILRNEMGRLLLQSNYRLAERLAWNPSWQLPETAFTDENGFLRVSYLDGHDED